MQSVPPASVVNVDRAWFIVSQRLSTNAQPSTRSTLCTPLSWFPGKRNRIALLKGRLIVGAVALVAILVAGINLLFPLMPGTSSVADAKQYQQIGLSQRSGGITITADKGYASDVGIAIVYQVQLPAALMKNLGSVLPTSSYIMKNQDGQRVQQHAAATTCSIHYGQPVKCYALMFEFHPNAGSNKLEIIWDITGVALSYISSSRPFTTTKVLKGHWQFHITLSFHAGKYIPQVPPDAR